MELNLLLIVLALPSCTFLLFFLPSLLPPSLSLSPPHIFLLLSTQSPVPVLLPEACWLPSSSPHTLPTCPPQPSLEAPMQPGKNPAWALTQHPTFIFTYLFPPISCTHKLLQLIIARENHSCHAPTLSDSIELPGNSQAASRAGTSYTRATAASAPPLESSAPHHPAWREVAGTCPSEVEGAPSWLRPPPKDLSTCLLHDSSLGATGRRITRTGCGWVSGFLSDFDILTQSCSTITNRSTLQDGRWG